MYANIDLNLRAVDDYYVFDVVLTDVRMSVLDYISSRANITILPGLGQDGNGVLSMGSESIEIELMDKTLVNAVEITKPIIWKKFLRTKSIAESQIQGGKLYKDEEIAFVISHTGIKKAGLDESSEPSDEAIKQAIYQHLEILPKRAIHSDVEIYTVDELQEKYDNLNNQFIRLAADFDNYRKRQAQEREQSVRHLWKKEAKKRSFPFRKQRENPVREKLTAFIIILQQKKNLKK